MSHLVVCQSTRLPQKLGCHQSKSVGQLARCLLAVKAGPAPTAERRHNKMASACIVGQPMQQACSNPVPAEYHCQINKCAVHNMQKPFTCWVSCEKSHLPVFAPPTMTMMFSPAGNDLQSVFQRHFWGIGKHACRSSSRACVGSTLVTLLHVTACLCPPRCTHFGGAKKYWLTLSRAFGTQCLPHACLALRAMQQSHLPCPLPCLAKDLSVVAINSSLHQQHTAQLTFRIH